MTSRTTQLGWMPSSSLLATMCAMRSTETSGATSQASPSACAAMEVTAGRSQFEQLPTTLDGCDLRPVSGSLGVFCRFSSCLPRLQLQPGNWPCQRYRVRPRLNHCWRTHNRCRWSWGRLDSFRTWRLCDYSDAGNRQPQARRSGSWGLPGGCPEPEQCPAPHHPGARKRQDKLRFRTQHHHWSDKDEEEPCPGSLNIWLRTGFLHHFPQDAREDCTQDHLVAAEMPTKPGNTDVRRSLRRLDESTPQRRHARVPPSTRRDSGPPLQADGRSSSEQVAPEIQQQRTVDGRKWLIGTLWVQPFSSMYTCSEFFYQHLSSTLSQNSDSY